MTFAFLKRMSLPGFEPGAFRLGGEPSIQLRYRDIYVLSLIFDFSALCMECFSQRSDRLRCNRNGVKLVASKIVEKTSIPGLAFDQSNHFCPQGIRLTEFLGGEPSIQLRYRDIYVLSLIFDFSALCMECFSQRSDRLRCNRNGVKLVASKIVEKTSIPGLAFDQSNHFCPQGIRLTEFLGGGRSIQLSYRDTDRCTQGAPPIYNTASCA